MKVILGKKRQQTPRYISGYFTRHWRLLVSTKGKMTSQKWKINLGVVGIYYNIAYKAAFFLLFRWIIMTYIHAIRLKKKILGLTANAHRLINNLCMLVLISDQVVVKHSLQVFHQIWERFWIVFSFLHQKRISTNVIERSLYVSRDASRYYRDYCFLQL